MKSPLWFEASMLAIILVASLVRVGLEQAGAHRSQSSAQSAHGAQPERLASQ